jgi:hypothetical protein
VIILKFLKGLYILFGRGNIIRDQINREGFEQVFNVPEGTYEHVRISNWERFLFSF